MTCAMRPQPTTPTRRRTAITCLPDSFPASYRIALDLVSIQLDPETRPSRGRYITVRIGRRWRLDWYLEEICRVARRVVRILQVRAARQAGRQVHIRNEPESAAPGVRHHLDSERLSQSSQVSMTPQSFGERHVRLHNVESSVLEQSDELFEVLIRLSPSNRDGRTRPQCAQLSVLVASQRLLEPGDAQRCQRLARLQRAVRSPARGGREALVGVHHERHIRTERAPSCLHYGDVLAQALVVQTQFEGLKSRLAQANAVLGACLGAAKLACACIGQESRSAAAPH